MIIDCGACSAQNFVSAERLAVRENPPRCWECGHPLDVGAPGSDTGGEHRCETGGSDPESNGGT